MHRENTQVWDKVLSCACARVRAFTRGKGVGVRVRVKALEREKKIKLYPTNHEICAISAKRIRTAASST